jgi:KDO2-lipid IV(A) lauroyltransferase
VFAASHFAAYEICGISSGALGVPLTTLWRPFDNPWLSGWVSKIRCRFGQHLVSNRGGMRRLFRDLRQGRSVAVLIDLNKRGRSVFVDYFGHPAATAETAARLAYRTGRPLIPVFAHRTDRPMTFEIDIAKPIWPDKARSQASEVRRLLQEATTEIERRVRLAPEQWLWTHRRWKTRPPPEVEEARA